MCASETRSWISLGVVVSYIPTHASITTLTMGGRRVRTRSPVRVHHRIACCTPQVRIRENHPSEELLCRLAHAPRPDPLAPQCASPVFLQVVLGGKCLALGVLERCATDEDLEERHAERPHVRLARVMRESPRAFRGEVLWESCERVLKAEKEKITSGVP